MIRSLTPDIVCPVNYLALGTVQFGLTYGISNQTGQVSRLEAKDMLQMALSSGIDTLDTAIAYGDSESCLGAAGTHGFKLITKLPELPDDTEDVGQWVQQQVMASLSRLGVSSVYGLLLHRSEQLLSLHRIALYQALQTLKETGQVQKVGISIYSPSELSALSPEYHFDLVQAPFNLIDRRLHSSGWMQRLKDGGTEIHTRSSFLQGLLLMSQVDMPAKFIPWSRLWNRWHRWLEDHHVSAVQACLAYPLSFPEIDRIVVGADSQAQLAQIINAASHQPLTELPDLECNDQDLINPSHWKNL